MHVVGGRPVTHPATASPLKHAKRQRCWTTSSSDLTVLALRRGKLPRLVSAFITNQHQVENSLTRFYSHLCDSSALVSDPDVQSTQRQPASQQHSLSMYFSRRSHPARHPDPASVRAPSLTVLVITDAGTFCSFPVSVTIATTLSFQPKTHHVFVQFQHRVVWFPHAGAHSTNLFWYRICCVGTFHMASFRSWCALHTRTTRCSDRWQANVFNY